MNKCQHCTYRLEENPKQVYLDLKDPHSGKIYFVRYCDQCGPIWISRFEDAMKLPLAEAIRAADEAVAVMRPRPIQGDNP